MTRRTTLIAGDPAARLATPIAAPAQNPCREIPLAGPERPDDDRLPRTLLDEALETGEGVPFELARGSAHAAGFDLACAWQDHWIPAGHSAMVGTGIAVAVPQGWVGLISLRSGFGTKSDADCHIGEIDADYRGEVKVFVRNHDKTRPIRLLRGQRFAQLTLLPHGADRFPPRRVARLPETARGEGGFGSTGS